jgi:hypothetical protein
MRKTANRMAARSCDVGSKPTRDRTGLTTAVTAQRTPHAAHVPAATWGEVPVIRCTPGVAPYPGQGCASVGLVVVDESRAQLTARRLGAQSTGHAAAARRLAVRTS